MIWSRMRCFDHAWDDLITHEMIWSRVRCFDHAWDDLITYEMLWSRMRWFDHVWDALITHEMIWSRGYVPRSVLSLGLIWLFIILWFFYFSSKCQNKFGPFFRLLKVSVCIKVLNTLNWSHNHFFGFLATGVSISRSKINCLQPLYPFFGIFYFLELGWDYLYFWGCRETIHLCASFYSILKIMATPYEQRVCHNISFLKVISF